jgi:hypothetical protein
MYLLSLVLSIFLQAGRSRQGSDIYRIALIQLNESPVGTIYKADCVKRFIFALI